MPPPEKRVSNQWLQALSQIRVDVLAKLAENDPTRHSEVRWLNALTPYDVKFLKTLRIQP